MVPVTQRHERNDKQSHQCSAGERNGEGQGSLRTHKKRQHFHRAEGLLGRRVPPTGSAFAVPPVWNAREKKKRG